MIVFNLVLLVFSFSCTSFRESTTTKPVKKVQAPIKKSMTKKPSKGNAVWHLLYPAEVELFLVHESGKKELIRIETNLSDIDLDKGHWQVEGLIWNGSEYEALAEGAKFEFLLQQKAPSYVGSFVVECPKVEAVNMKEIRKMEFFNRFSFTSPQGTCEMLVGNDLIKVRKAWSKLEKSSPKKLLLGF